MGLNVGEPLPGNVAQPEELRMKMAAFSGLSKSAGVEKTDIKTTWNKRREEA